MKLCLGNGERFDVFSTIARQICVSSWQLSVLHRPGFKQASEEVRPAKFVMSTAWRAVLRV